MTSEDNIQAVIPVLDVGDVRASVKLFEGLGFDAYAVQGDPPAYACLRAGSAELHLRPNRLVKAPGTQTVRIRVRDAQSLGDDLYARNVTFVNNGRPTQELHVVTTPHGTVEFHVYEPNGHSITFYQDV